MYDTETVVRKGCMPLPFGWVSRTIYAGPYLDKPDDMVGIKCAAEIKSPSAMKVDIQDFGIPYRNEHVYEAVKFALDRAAEGLPIYVGCRGGFGRTGLFLGVLARSMGVPDPVAYVRNNYDRHAIETPGSGNLRPATSTSGRCRRPSRRPSARRSGTMSSGSLASGATMAS
jgi:hypothetical protein